MGRLKTLRVLLLSMGSTSGGGQRWLETMCKNMPKSIKPYVIFTRIGHPGNIFYHRLQPWLAPHHLQYNKLKSDWPQQVAEFIDKEKVDVLLQEEDERLREIIDCCKHKPRVVYVKHVMDPRGDIAANADIISQVVCVSERIAENVPGAIVIRNGVPPPESSGIDIRALFGIRPEEFVVGYMGRVDRNKNVNFLIALAEQNHWRVLIVGRPDHALRRYGAAVVVPADVYYTADWYKAMNVFVLPSRNEGFPLAPMEALLSGTPVAMTPVSDYPGLFDGAVSFFAPDSLIEATDAIKSAPDPKIGQAIINKHCNVKNMVAAYVKVLRGDF